MTTFSIIPFNATVELSEKQRLITPLLAPNKHGKCTLSNLCIGIDKPHYSAKSIIYRVFAIYCAHLDTSRAVGLGSVKSGWLLRRRGAFGAMPGSEHRSRPDLGPCRRLTDIQPDTREPPFNFVHSILYTERFKAHHRFSHGSDPFTPSTGFCDQC